MNKLKNNLSKYISIDDISIRIEGIAAQLSEIFYDDIPIFIGILNGSFIFLSDLIRKVNFECEIDFIKVASYDGIETTGKIILDKDINLDIKNKRVIIVEDIIDSGLTINYLYKHILSYNPKDISIVTLLSKKDNYNLNFDIDVIGFEITTEFVVGYGLDLNQRFRQLDCLYKLKP
ncbi:MAG: hypoxanthine phosphoribosyltransferase [bacterium TMED217]|nr:MAG: hypoxanthine phosphoribosyltransferase [bacterium TMED217]|tara:strand:+ start:12719 stop:13246 length:528 start_codon:yes stop_codon:yes gene_type:complete